MKRNAYLLCVVIIVGALMISVCSSKKQTGPVEHQQLTWHEKRDKPFGTFDYPKIKENEAFDLLENKFKVKIPKFISQVKGMLQNDVMTEGVQTGVSEYTMYASSVELKVRAYYPLNEGNELSVFALVDLKYSFNKEKKEVRLTSQSLSMTTYGEKIAYPKDNYDELLAKSTEIIDLSNELSNRSIQHFKEDYKEVAKRPTSAKAVEKKKVSQSLLGEFDSKQELKELYATIVDYTD